MGTVCTGKTGLGAAWKDLQVCVASLRCRNREIDALFVAVSRECALSQPPATEVCGSQLTMWTLDALNVWVL